MSEIKQILETIAGSPERTCGDHQVYSPGPMNKASVDAAVSSLKSGEVVVVDREQIMRLAGLLACIGSTLSAVSNSRVTGVKQATRVYAMLMNAVGPTFSEEGLLAYLRGETREEAEDE